MRVVIDTNVLVSAFLWGGTPGQLIESAGEQAVQLFTSRTLLDELSEVLHRQKLAKSVQATGFTAVQLVRNFRRLARLVAARKLAQQVSRDPDDDHVLACALAANAHLIISGDADLLDLRTYQGIRIVNAVQAVRSIGSTMKRNPK